MGRKKGDGEGEKRERRKNWALSLTLYTKIKWEKITGLNVKHETLIFLTKKKEKKKGENLQDLGPGKEFLDLTPNTQSIKINCYIVLHQN